MGVRRPYQTHGACEYPGHAEAEDHARDDELASPPEIDLEERHVCDRAHDKQRQEHRCDGAVELLRGLPAQASRPGRIGCVLWWRRLEELRY